MNKLKIKLIEGSHVEYKEIDDILDSYKFEFTDSLDKMIECFEEKCKAPASTQICLFNFNTDQYAFTFLCSIHKDELLGKLYNRNHVPMMSDKPIKISEFVLPPRQQILQTNQYQLVVSPLFNISKVVEYALPTDGSRLIQIIIEDIMKMQRFQEQKEPDVEEKERKELEALAEKLLKKFLGSEK
jgi:hypothetical protein